MSTFEFTKEFRESLHALPCDVQEFVKEKLGFYASCEHPLLLAKKLKGIKDVYRFRIGDYRVIFDVSGTIITILNLGHRREIYR